jgi:uncharacterized protein involved in exopolysaccharide biosynthesis
VTTEHQVERVGVLRLTNVLLQRWKLVVGLPMAAAVLTAIISLLLPARFTATVTFVPEAEESGLPLPSGIMGLAAQFGVALPAEGTNSPDFYAEVLHSRTLLDEVLLTQFADPRSEASRDSIVLLDVLEIEGETTAQRLEAGRAELRDISEVSVDNATDIVALAVETRYPALSAEVANHFIALLNRFNLETRQSNAQERRRFIEGRVDEVERELWEAEEALKEFLEGNRQYLGSPELKFQYDRLSRQVVLKQEVLSTLRRQYEDARIQEVNDTPVITVIDAAVPPVEKSSPQRTLSVIMAFILGGILAVAGAFSADYLDRARISDEGDYQEIKTRWAEIRREVGGLFRHLFRRV